MEPEAPIYSFICFEKATHKFPSTTSPVVFLGFLDWSPVFHIFAISWLLEYKFLMRYFKYIDGYDICYCFALATSVCSRRSATADVCWMLVYCNLLQRYALPELYWVCIAFPNLGCCLLGYKYWISLSWFVRHIQYIVKQPKFRISVLGLLESFRS